MLCLEQVQDAPPARMATAPIADALDCRDVEQTDTVRLVERVPDLPWTQELRQVEERASDAGDRDPVTCSPVVGMQVADVVQAETGPSVTSASGVGDVDRPGYSPVKLPERPSVTVAEKCSRAARQHRCQPPGAPRDGEVSDGVDAPVDTVQTPDRQTLNRSSAEAQGRQLAPRHDPVLPARDSGKPAFGTWSTLCTSDVHKIDQFHHRRQRDRSGRAGGSRAYRCRQSTHTDQKQPARTRP